MTRPSVVFLLPALILSAPLWCQQQVASASLPDSPAPHGLAGEAPDPGPGGEAFHRHGYPTGREESFRALPLDFLHDQKEVWGVFPGQVAKGHHWVPVLATAGITAGLLYADPHVMTYFRNHEKNLSDLNSTFSSYISAGEIAAVPVGLLLVGAARHDPYQTSTAWLGADAYADSAIPPLVIKAIARRERPSQVPVNTPFQDEFFKNSWYGGSSFPSGHAAAAFSVATVVASRYRNHVWAPVLAYGMATVIGLSRITGREHYPSDVFVGSVIGVTTAEFAALRPR
ncbi:MAG TPA: phosphatase PAP2 family protein [Acidobacteriaceae bacterium]|nr:phosphatase PAP2 family protein [Acidobacteriaceae bacterium]